MHQKPTAAIDWLITPGLVAYPAAVAAMEERVASIARGEAPELVWLLEHPPLYTAGTSACAEDLLEPRRLPVFRSGRGGQFTYHGPGQRVVYLVLDLGRRGGDVRGYVHSLERLVIDVLDAFGIRGEVRSGRVGVWVRRPPPEDDREDKIAAIGIRVRRWIAFHGLSLNVAPDLSHFAGIVPCGIRGQGVTSLAALGCRATMAEVDECLRKAFEARFGLVRSCADDPRPGAPGAVGALPAGNG